MHKQEYLQTIQFFIEDTIEVYVLYHIEDQNFRIELFTVSSFVVKNEIPVIVNGAYTYTTATDCFKHICMQYSKRRKCEIKEVRNPDGATFITVNEQRKLLKEYDFQPKISSS